MPAVALHQRKRGSKGSNAVPVEPPPTAHNNGLYAWGFDYEGGLGGGYEHFGPGYNFPQGIIGMSHVVQMACGERTIVYLDDKGRIYMNGSNRGGQQGQGTGAQEALEESQPTPQRILGDVPLYLPEVLEDKKGTTFHQPLGPTGPVVPAIAAVAAGNNTAYALTQDGRALAWGNDGFGQTASGWEPEKGENPKLKLESGKWRPQAAPWWVQTGGPAQSETGGHPGGMRLVSGVAGQPSQAYVYDHDVDPLWGSGTRANILSGIRAMAVAHTVAFFLMNDGTVMKCGWLERENLVADFIFVATPDLLWNSLGIKSAIAICAGRRSYGLLLADGTVRIVGVVQEGTSGEGFEETGAHRVVSTPMVAPGVPLSGIVALSQGEYHYKALDSSGRLWTWGSNGNEQNSTGRFLEEGQQMLGPREAPVLRPTQITSLGNNVAAVACGGMERGTGTFGGDTCCALLKDGTLRTAGKNFDPGAPGGADRGQGTGALGDDSYDSSGLPKTPKYNGSVLGNVKLIEAGMAHMVVAQEPGSPVAPSCLATSPESRKCVIDWSNFPGTVGQIPLWRDADTWDVTLQQLGTDPASIPSGKPKGYKTLQANGLPTVTKSDPARPTNNHIFAGVNVVLDADFGHRFEAAVVEHATTEKPAITGGSIQTANGAGERPIAWADPVKSEPGWYVWWQRVEQFKSVGHTTVAGVGAKAGDMAIALTSANGLTVGQWLWIGPGEELVVIASVNSKTGLVGLVAPLTKAHPVGENVIKGEVEDFHRSNLLPGAARAYTIQQEVSAHGLTGKQLTMLVEGSFAGAFRKRVFYVDMLP